jgi:hypothetical protein
MEEEDIGEATQLSQSGSVMAYKRSAKSTWKVKKRAKTGLGKAGANGPGRVNLRALSIRQNTNLVSITRTVDYGQVSSATGADKFVGQVFKLNDLPNYTQFTALFDEFRIRAIKVYLIPSFNVNTTASAQLTIPQLISAIDYDDAGTPSNTATIYSFDTARVHGVFDRMYTRTFKPAISIAAYSGGFTAYAQRQDQWIDCNSPGTSHYALKYGIVNANNGSSTMDVYCEATFYLQFRKAV